MPKKLILTSLKVADRQDGPNATDLYSWEDGTDEIRLFVVLDGFPVKLLAFSAGYEDVKSFNASDNLTDPEFTKLDPDDKDPDPTNLPREFIFWSLAEITAYEGDNPGGTLIDGDPDEWVHTVRLDQSIMTSPDKEIRIGKSGPSGSMSNGRSDTDWLLKYRIEDYSLPFDPSFMSDIGGSANTSPLLNQSGSPTGNFAVDKGNCRWICSIDGGGLRGIFALRMLEQLEKYYNKTCFEMFDMFAGTSTGSIIASLLANGYSIQEAINFYANPIVRNKIFRTNKRGQLHAFKYLDLKGIMSNGSADLSNALYPNKILDIVEHDSTKDALMNLVEEVSQQIMTPKYIKTGMKEVLYKGFSRQNGTGLIPKKLRESGKDGVSKDILITARDMHRNETTFFTAFHLLNETLNTSDFSAWSEDLPRPRPVVDPRGPRRPEKIVTGTYNELFLKDVVEASSSAPIFFSPRSQFSDGGIGVQNNPSFIAAIEALNFSNIDPSNPERKLKPKYIPYKEEGGVKSGTVVWSFGTAYSVPNPEAPADMPTLISGSISLKRRTDVVLYWIGQVMENLMTGANQEQDFLCREVLKDKIKYLRFNVGLNRNTLFDLDIDGDRDQVLEAIKLDSLENFHLMDDVAKQFAFYARNASFGFNNAGREGYQMTGLRDVPITTYATTIRQNFAKYE